MMVPEQKNFFEGKEVIFIESEDDAENADGVKGHLEVVGESNYKPTFYDRFVKRGLDILFSFSGLVVLSPIMGAIALAIKFEDPGPVFLRRKGLVKTKNILNYINFVP